MALGNRGRGIGKKTGGLEEVYRSVPKKTARGNPPGFSLGQWGKPEPYPKKIVAIKT